MNPGMHEVELLDLQGTVAAPELGRMCGLSVDNVFELLEYGLLTPVTTSAEGPVFSAACIEPLRQAASLRTRFDLDVFVVGLLFSHIERSVVLERRVRALEAQLPRPLP